MPTTAHSSEGTRPADYFATTHWSIVLTAGRGDTPRARQALEKLCQTYWYPLYAYARRRGRSPEDAKDLTQEFFARLLESNSIGNADPNRGRFRSFLLGAMNHCLADATARARAQKRGSGTAPVPLELIDAEQRYQLEPASSASGSADAVFDRQWATTLLSEVLNRLEREYREEGKAQWFEALKQTLIGSRESQAYAALARQLGVAEPVVRTAVHRLRKRYRSLIRDEIANTVESPEEVDDEMRYLLKVALTGSPE